MKTNNVIASCTAALRVTVQLAITLLIFLAVCEFHACVYKVFSHILCSDIAVNMTKVMTRYKVVQLHK